MSGANINWHIYKKPRKGFAVRASRGHDNVRQLGFETMHEAREFVTMMTAKTIQEQLAWINARPRGSGSPKQIYSTVGRMQTEWAKTHPQVRVVGGWRGRPCGGGNVGVRGIGTRTAEGWR